MGDKSFSEVVKDCIEKFKENATPSVYDRVESKQIDVCKIVSEHNFLPIFYDWTAFCSVRPDGEMVWCEYENPRKLDIEENRRIRNIAMVKGIEFFPELLPFMPCRGINDIDCPHCDSVQKTREQMPEHLRKPLNCYCGGLGWIPKDVW